jgi:hypothetical protein
MAAVCAYISAVWAGTEDPVWPHLVLIPLSVLAGIAVGVGIVYETPKHSAKAHERAFWAVVLGIAIESLCTVFLFIVDERISAAQQSRIEAQQSKIIELETKLTPRVLTDEQQKSLVAVAKEFAPQPYTLSTAAAGSEPAAFLCVIDATLQKAGWVRMAPIDLIHTKPCKGGATEWEAGVNVISGVHIRGSIDALPSTKKAAMALASTLIADGIEAQAEADPAMKDATITLVMIGAKL